MIELKDLDKETRTKLLRNIEYCPHLMWKKTPFLRGVHSKLVEEFGDDFKQELWVFLTFTAKCVRYETKGFQISLNRTHYTAANKFYKHKLSRDRMKTLLSDLESKGYIIFLKGYYRNENDYTRSVVVLTHKILSMIDVNVAKNQAISRRDYLGLIEVVDTSKTEIKRYRNKNGKLVKIKKPILKNNQHVRGSKEKSLKLIKYNNQLASTLITIDDEVEKCIIYKRRFEDNLDSCGRYYCGDYQTERSFLRQTITMNGNPTCEADYSTMQPACLFASKGLVLDYDPYDTGVVTRDQGKSLFMAILFSRSRQGAKVSIKEKLRSWGLEHLDTEEVLQAFEEHNSQIKDCFYNRESYKWLQNLDARMAEYIIDYFTDEGITVLCWHDSFVIESIHKDKLIDKMKEAWSYVMGNDLNCKVKIEFDNSLQNHHHLHPAFEDIPLEYYEGCDSQEECFNEEYNWVYNYLEGEII